MTVSISRNSPCGPRVSRIEINAPMGRPRYNNGNTDAAVRPSTSRSPRQDASATDASTTNVDNMITSSSTALSVATSFTHNVEVTPTDASSVAAPLVTAGTPRPTARHNPAYSMNASSSSASATKKNNAAGANQTTEMAMTTSAAPLTTRVTWRSGQ